MIVLAHIFGIPVEECLTAFATGNWPAVLMVAVASVLSLLLRDRSKPRRPSG